MERRIGADSTQETRHTISSLSGAAVAFAGAVRGHRSIENICHWVLDIAFREDDCRVRKGNAAQNLAILRPIALSLLQKERSTKVGVKANRLKTALDENYLIKVLTG